MDSNFIFNKRVIRLVRVDEVCPGEGEELDASSETGGTSSGFEGVCSPGLSSLATRVDPHGRPVYAIAATEASAQLEGFAQPFRIVLDSP